VTAPEEWIPAYAEALGLGLDEAEIDAVLALARDVAHGTERKNPTRLC
jgi:hypothetical protein